MTDPIEGRYGQLVMTGWIAAAPTGRDEAYLMLTTPAATAPTTMPVVAQLLGLQPGHVVRQPATTATIQLGDDGWAALVIDGERFERPVSEEWAGIARDRGRVVLVVGTAPMPAGMDPDTYTDQHGHTAAIGLIPVG